ncbi:hypothetical protein TEA_008007 [Camellia sinensis var. sinensis]|uniref:XPG N-terminal domain-containing protein n=1 Tax=Camellia sinensis var. sinensis TaxID=542762 RepID=A0A4S4DSE7_CAMSN|nr:hypothetical protein TEA_008007 [Camellia sinensis var. sinensis]
MVCLHFIDAIYASLQQLLHWLLRDLDHGDLKLNHGVSSIDHEKSGTNLPGLGVIVTQGVSAIGMKGYCIWLVSKHIDYCMHRVNLLRHYDVTPILVFDGGLLPMKSEQETKRARLKFGGDEMYKSAVGINMRFRLLIRSGGNGQEGKGREGRLLSVGYAIEGGNHGKKGGGGVGIGLSGGRERRGGHDVDQGEGKSCRGGGWHR